MSCKTYDESTQYTNWQDIGIDNWHPQYDITAREQEDDQKYERRVDETGHMRFSQLLLLSLISAF